MLQAGDVLALRGDLAAGKTTMTVGVARGMGLDADVHSPTFTLIHEHHGRIPLYHVDLYRLSGPEETETIGLDDYIHGDGVTVIEWADRTSGTLPARRLDVEMRMIDDFTREIRLASGSDRMDAVIEEIKRQCS